MILLMHPKNNWHVYERVCHYHEELYPTKPAKHRVESASSIEWFGACLHFREINKGNVCLQSRV